MKRLIVSLSLVACLLFFPQLTAKSACYENCTGAGCYVYYVTSFYDSSCGSVCNYACCVLYLYCSGRHCRIKRCCYCA